MVALGQVVDGRIDRRRGHHELGVTSAQAQLNRARSELAGDLLSRRRQHVLQSEADRCVQRCDKALGERTSVITTGLGGNRELVVDVIDVEPQIYGAIIAPTSQKTHTLNYIPMVQQRHPWEFA